MWQLAFMRPVEDVTSGPDAYTITEKSAQGAQSSFYAVPSIKDAIAYLNSRGFEPINGAIDVATNRWMMVWKLDVSSAPKASAAAPVASARRSRGRPPKMEKPQAAPEAAAAEVAAPKRRGRPPKAKSVGAAAAAPAKRGRGRPKKIK